MGEAFGNVCYEACGGTQCQASVDCHIDVTISIENRDFANGDGCGRDMDLEKKISCKYNEGLMAGVLKPSCTKNMFSTIPQPELQNRLFGFYVCS